ncbi:MAG TPA: type II secretion system F family protein [Acidobacteriaceae bacterium]|nr:type II secretion system F family protein [Acidobacteriaceae bacterium]
MLFVIFIVFLSLTFTIVILLTRPSKSQKRVEHRLAAIHRGSAQPEEASTGLELVKPEEAGLVRKFSEHLEGYPWIGGLQSLILHAGSGMTVGSLVLSSAGAAAGAALLTHLWMPVAPTEAAAALACGCAPSLWLLVKRTRRLKAFNASLPEAIDLMARALRAGHSVNSAIEMVAEQSPQPLGGEFAQVFHEQRLGLRFRDALIEMTRRVASKDLHFLVTAILVQKETGGDLTEILDRTAYVIRERIRIAGEVKVYTAQGRLTGWILSSLPLVMLALINVANPGYSRLLFHDPLGQKLLYAGGALIAVGGLIIRKVVDIRV